MERLRRVQKQLSPAPAADDSPSATTASVSVLDDDGNPMMVESAMGSSNAPVTLRNGALSPSIPTRGRFHCSNTQKP